MYDQLPADPRRGHPYHMHDEILSQPQAIARSIAIVAEQGEEAADSIARARRVVVTGCGTSFHAALGGAEFLRSFSRGAIDARAVEAYELLTYYPTLRPDDLVIAVSHSGGSAMTVRVLESADRVGAETVLITGFPESKAGLVARHVVQTGYSEERSWAHTASYTASLATFAALANALAEADERLDLSPLPDLVTDVLGVEQAIHRMAASTVVAEQHAPVSLVLVGAGPNAATAQEGVLKFLETSYVSAMAFQLEEILHGPLAAIDESTAVILIAPSGRSNDRNASLYRALLRLGATPLVLCGQENASTFDEAHRLALPEIPEVLSPIPYVVPLQLLSYFVAEGKGFNPDLIHRDDERQRLARGEYV